LRPDQSGTHGTSHACHTLDTPLIIEHNAINICTGVIIGEKQNLNKQTLEFKNFHTFSVLNGHFGQIQYFFKV